MLICIPQFVQELCQISVEKEDVILEKMSLTVVAKKFYIKSGRFLVETKTLLNFLKSKIKENPCLEKYCKRYVAKMKRRKRFTFIYLNQTVSNIACIDYFAEAVA